MRVYIVCAVVLALVVVNISAQAATLCTTTNDCPCGEVCVAGRSVVQTCAADQRCKCKAGCAVADVFIKAGKGRKAYCNRCNCDADPASKNSLPACTRAAWCGLPENIPLYVDNTNCQTTPM